MTPCRPQNVEARRSKVEQRSNDEGRTSKVSSFLLPPPSLVLPESFRSGATLTEVLMSMLIFSIGVVSIFSLFPISIVRSIRATQLTSSKLFEENFTQLIRMRPEILTAHVPASSNSAPPAVPSGGPWQPHRAYTSVSLYPSCDLVSSGGRSGGLLQDPFGIYACMVVDLPAGTPSSTTQYVSNITPPSWQIPKAYVFPNNRSGANAFLNNGPRSPDDGLPGDSIGIAWLPVSGHWLNLNARGYVVDPLGFWTVFADNGGNNLSPFGSTEVQMASQFGKHADKTGTSGVNLNSSSLNSIPGWGTDADGSVTHLPRINGGVGVPLTTGGPGVSANLAVAQRIASYSDSWTVDYNGAALGVANNSTSGLTEVRLPPNVQLSTSMLSNANMRMVLRAADGRATTRPIEAINGQVVTLAQPALPTTGTTSITVSEITDVRIESYDARYTWLATVNNRVPGHPRITIAVYFNRKFTPGDEHVYAAVFGNEWNSGGPPRPTAPGFALPTSMTTDQVYIAWDANAEPLPTFTEGNYIFDAVNVDWYEIIDVTTASAAQNGRGTDFRAVLITLDRPVEVGTPPAGLVGRAMAPRGIVKLFEL